MCFSANASFGVSVLLMVGGIVAVRKIKDKRQLPFAAIPILFSIQQFTEGFLWMSLSNSAYVSWHTNTTYVFLFFAQVVWPLWVPLAMLLMEKERIRIIILKIILATGCMVSIFLAYCLLNYTVSSEISNHHIKYNLLFENNYIKGGSVLYFIATVISPFLSSVKKMSFIGTIILLSYLVSKLFYSEYVISVWCYFAAAISIIILYIIESIRKTEKATVISAMKI